MGGKLVIPVKNNLRSYTLTVTTDIPLTKFQVKKLIRILFLSFRDYKNHKCINQDNAQL